MSDDLLQPGPTHRLQDGTVLSVQRLATGGDLNADAVGERYFEWLPGLFLRLIRVRVNGARIELRLLGVTLIALRADVITPLRAHYDITGGALARVPGGALVFSKRLAHDDMIAVVQGFRPRLPWWLYACTQRPLHVWSMRRFAAMLARSPSSNIRSQETT